MRNRSILAALLVAALLIPACTKHRVPAWHEGGSQQNHGGNSGGNNNGGNQNPGGNGGDQQQGLTLKLRTDWSIRYEGREVYQEDNGTFSDVERITVSCPDAEYFMVRVLTDADLANYKEGLKTFLEEEEKYIAEDAKNYDCSFSDLNYIYNTSISAVLLDRFLHGEYHLYLVGIDKNGKITGNYAAANAVIEEERPSDEYKAWLGEWLISDGEVGYRIVISQREANWLYRIDGWETGKSIASNGMQMDQEWIEASIKDDGSLSFYSQYLGGYEDENWGWLDEYFLGNVESMEGNIGITDTGLEIGVASFEPGSTAVATLTGSAVSVRRDNGSNWNTSFSSMCYWSYCDKPDDNGNYWLPYNENIPTFPLTLTRTKASGTVSLAPERIVNSHTIHRGQPANHGKAAIGSNSVKANGVR